MVLACPESGETRALTHRMGYLAPPGVPPAAMLGITFPRAAAAEMKARLARRIPPAPARQVRLFTFRGLAYRILKAARGRPQGLDVRGLTDPTPEETDAVEGTFGDCRPCWQTAASPWPAVPRRRSPSAS